jgi:hypothetical protein
MSSLLIICALALFVQCGVGGHDRKDDVVGGQAVKTGLMDAVRGRGLSLGLARSAEFDTTSDGQVVFDARLGDSSKWARPPGFYLFEATCGRWRKRP